MEKSGTAERGRTHTPGEGKPPAVRSTADRHRYLTHTSRRNPQWQKARLRGRTASPRCYTPGTRTVAKLRRLQHRGEARASSRALRCGGARKKQARGRVRRAEFFWSFKCTMRQIRGDNCCNTCPRLKRWPPDVHSPPCVAAGLAATERGRVSVAAGAGREGEAAGLAATERGPCTRSLRTRLLPASPTPRAAASRRPQRRR